MNHLKEFNQCTSKKVNRCSVDIECKLGLWSVSSYCELEAVAEGLRYFNQYKADGEYSSIIGGKSVKEVLASKLN